jgi:hypothetical protein
VVPHPPIHYHRGHRNRPLGAPEDRDDHVRDFQHDFPRRFWIPLVAITRGRIFPDFRPRRHWVCALRCDLNGAQQTMGTGVCIYVTKKQSGQRYLQHNTCETNKTFCHSVARVEGRGEGEMVRKKRKKRKSNKEKQYLITVCCLLQKLFSSLETIILN